MHRREIIAAASAALLIAGSASAQPAGGATQGHNMAAMKDFDAAMSKMNKDMMAAMGKTMDATFARKMIAHHQGAIDMARIELQHGSDAEAKRMAQKTIDENTKGIAELQGWLRAHGG
jgi:uncharacterized protein (DUF305 family)